MSKRCTKCKEIKELDQFIIDSRAVDGHQNKCKLCRSNYLSARYATDSEKVEISTRRWQDKNRDKMKNSRLKRLYGITLDQRRQKLEDQVGRCPLCLRHQDELSRPLMVDHCHKTGKIRDLLCFSCNAALGSLRDDLATALRVVEYIQKHNTSSEGANDGNSN